LRKEDDVEEDAGEIRTRRLLPGEVDQQADIVEHEKRNSDRQRQPQQEINGRKADQCRRRRIEEQELVFEEGEQREVEGDPERQEHRALFQRQDQEQIAAEHRDRQQRQQL